MLRTHWLCLIVCLGCSSAPKPTPELGSAAAAPPTEQEPVPLGQLQGDVVPTAYRLDLTLIPSKERFSGIVKIDVELSRATDRFYMHANDLEVTVARLDDVNGVLTQKSATGAAELVLESTVPAGSATLHFEYTAPFNRALEGIYRVDEAGEAYAFSQFEAIGARLAFPCFDEPRFKTPFDLAVTTSAGNTVISTTPEVELGTLEDGSLHYVFDTTRPLPTYLIAFAVGPLDVVEWEPVATNALRAKPIPLRGIAAKGKSRRLEFALKNTAVLVTTLEEYFGIPYPYAKLDLIAAPDYAFGAMENVGAIIYREERLLLDETSPFDQRQQFFSTHSHELAHQWFGNFVTPVWWTDIWLNESFASWMGNWAANAARPKTGFERMTLRRAIGVMDDDALITARQIREPVDADAEIWNAFDGITYRKGGGVLQMFEGFLGDTAFREGVRLHMKRFAHDVADANDFATSLADGSGKPEVVEAFQTFIEQPGIPLVTVESQCNEGKGTLRFSQNRYRPLGSEIDPDATWGLPFCFATFDERGRSEPRCELIESSEATLGLDTCVAAVLPNAGGQGYYHFALGGAGFEPLLQRFASLTPSEQLATFASLEASFRAGSATLDEMLAGVRKAASSKAWDVKIAPLPLLEEFIDLLDVEGARKLAANLYRPVLTSIGIKTRATESVGNSMMRADLVRFLALIVKHDRTRDQLLPIAQRHLAGKTRASEKAVAKTALAVAAEKGGESFIQSLRDRLAEERDGFARSEIVYALAFAPRESLGAIFDLVLGDEIRVNESLALIESISNETYSSDGVAWIRENLDSVRKRFTAQLVGQLFKLSHLCDNDSLQILESFTASADTLRGAARPLAQSTETTKLCIALKEQLSATAAAPQ